MTATRALLRGFALNLLNDDEPDAFAQQLLEWIEERGYQLAEAAALPPEQGEPPAVPHEACAFGQHIPLQDRIDAIARALYTAGVARDSLDKDGLPRLVAAGVYANLRNVQRLDLFRPTTAADVIEEMRKEGVR